MRDLPKRKISSRSLGSLRSKQIAFKIWEKARKLWAAWNHSRSSAHSHDPFPRENDVTTSISTWQLLWFFTLWFKNATSMFIPYLMCKEIWRNYFTGSSKAVMFFCKFAHELWKVEAFKLFYSLQSLQTYFRLHTTEYEIQCASRATIPVISLSYIVFFSYLTSMFSEGRVG